MKNDKEKRACLFLCLRFGRYPARHTEDMYHLEIHAESELIRFGSFINTGPVVFKKHVH